MTLVPLSNQSSIDFANDAMRAVSAWLRDNPVIENPDMARDANDVLTSALLTMKDLDDHRKEQVEPLNRQLSSINALFRSIRVPFENAIDELKRRLTAYMDAEERKRRAAAARLKAEADALEQAARDAEAAEQQAIANASVGECVDVGAAIEDAEAAFSDYVGAARDAQLAQRDAQVRLRSRFGDRARSLRNIETLEVVNAVAAIQALGCTEKISAAICAEAKLYRRAKGALPPGVIGTTTRGL